MTGPVKRPGRRRRLLYGGLVIVIGGLAVAAVFYRADGPNTEADARTVYCLAPSHITDLLGAAVALGLVQPGAAANQLVVRGRAISVAQWRAGSGGDFDRACDAESAVALPQSSKSSRLESALSTAAPVILGGLVALVSGDLGATRERRRTQADALRATWQGFAEAFWAYVEVRAAGSPHGVPPPDTVNLRRGEVVAMVRRANVAHRGWEAPGKLISSLEAELGPAIKDGWGPDRADIAKKANDLRTAMGAASGLLEQVAAGIERVVRPGRGV